MSKKYLAKYLPIEGKIKDGTKVMFKIKNKWTEPCDFDLFDALDKNLEYKQLFSSPEAALQEGILYTLKNLI